MWRALSAGLVALAGCFAPDLPTGLPCAPATEASAERCPGGQLCVVHDGVETCETNDVGDEPDGDGDGIADSIDNCPELANADQLDEERDGFGDACDLCPVFDDANLDLDGDGVSDACDPDPDQPGNTIVAFEGFGRPLGAAWQQLGTVVVENGELIATAGDNVSTIVSIPSPSGSRVEIRATARLLALNATGDNLGAVNLIERQQPLMDRAVACQLSGLADGTEQQLRIFDLGNGSLIDTAGHPFTVGGELDLRLRRDGATDSCRATGPALELAGTSTFSPADPHIGLRVRGADATFHWVMVVTRPVDAVASDP